MDYCGMIAKNRVIFLKTRGKTGKIWKKKSYLPRRESSTACLPIKKISFEPGKSHDLNHNVIYELS